METTDNPKLAPGDWEPYFRKANVRVEELEACKGSHSKAVKIGRFLSPNVGREVPIRVNGRTGKAVLRVAEERAKVKRYFFEVTWDDQNTATSAASSDESTAAKKRVKRAGEKTATKAKKVRGAKTPPNMKTNPDTGEKPAESPAGGNDEDW